MIRTALQEPGDAGTYDAETSLAGLDFSPDLLAPFFEPADRNWRQLLAAYHEWVHFYQYHATSYGYLYRQISNTQLLLVNGVLRIAREERGRRRERLPLVAAHGPLTGKESHPNDANLRCIAMLQQQRDGVLGYGPHIPMAELGEWRLACQLFGELFGGPQTVVIEPTFMPAPVRVRYPVTHLLETHAHVLSAMWLMLAVDRSGGDRRIIRAVVEQANEQLVGPYSAFTQFVPGLPATEPERLKLFCALAEIALNPPGIHRHPKMSWHTMISPQYTSWFPVVRLETLMADALDGYLRWPEADAAWPGWGQQLLESVAAGRTRRGDLPGAMLPATDGQVAQPALDRTVDRILRYADIEGDVPIELLTFQLDTLAKLCVAEQLRQASPLLLSGVVIDELKLLVGGLGGPSTMCRHGTDSWTVIAPCTGLMRLGLLNPDTLAVGSDAIVNAGAPIAQALQLLLLNNHQQLERVADKPLFGRGPWTLRRVLAEHYRLTLADFD